MALDDKPSRRERIAGDFASVVNMSAEELRQWLRTKASRSVGWKGPDGNLRESVGHASGRRIVTLLGKNSDELSAAITTTCKGSSASFAATSPSRPRTRRRRAGAIC